MLFKDFDKKISTNFVRRTTYEIYDAYRKRGFIYQKTVAWHKLGFNSKFNRFIKKKKSLRCETVLDVSGLESQQS